MTAEDRIRPSSAQLVDLHVYLVPSEQWRDHTRSVISKIIDESISIGFVRVQPESNLYSLREEIHNQLGDDIRHDYSFLRGVGRHLARIRPKQEFQLKVKSFLPPQTYSPEIFIVELTNGLSTSLPSSEISSNKSEHLDSYMLQLGLHRSERNEFPNHKSVIPPIGKVTLAIQTDERNITQTAKSTSSPLHNITTNGLPYEGEQPAHVSSSKDSLSVPHRPTVKIITPNESPRWGVAEVACQQNDNRLPSPRLRQATPKPSYHDDVVAHPLIRQHSPPPPPPPRLQYAEPETQHPSRVKTPRPSLELRLDAACQTNNADYVDGQNGQGNRNSQSLSYHDGRHTHRSGGEPATLQYDYYADRNLLTPNQRVRDLNHSPHPRNQNSPRNLTPSLRQSHDVHSTQRNMYDGQYHQTNMNNVLGKRDYPSHNRGVYPSGNYRSDGRGDYAFDGRSDYPSGGRGDYPSDGRGDYPSNGRGDYPSISQGGYPVNGRGGFPTADGYPALKSGVQEDVDDDYHPTRGPALITHNSEVALMEKRRAQELYRQEIQQLEAEERRQMTLQQQQQQDQWPGQQAPMVAGAERPESITDDEKWPGAGITEEWPGKTTEPNKVEGLMLRDELPERDEPEVMTTNDHDEKIQPAKVRPVTRQEADDTQLSDRNVKQPDVGDAAAAAADNNKDASSEKAELLDQLHQVKGDRILMERQREELVKKAKELQNRTKETREQSKCIWKQQYFTEKKKAASLEDEAQQMQRELEGLHRRIMSQMETSNRGSGLRTNNKPSQQSNLVIQATRIRHDIEGLERKAENVKMKLNAEIKLKQQVEVELKAMRASILHNKMQAKITPRPT